MRNLTLGGVAVVAAVLLQLAIPASMIGRREVCLRQGEPFRFKTRPVDPYDAFRGRFVALALDAATAPATTGAPARRGERLYAWITVNSDGTASFSKLTREAPDDTPYLAVRARRNGNEEQTWLKLPFDRFYMDENEAPEAEEVYRRGVSGENTNAFAVVRIRKGLGVLEDLVVAGRPIRDHLAAP